MLIDEHVDPKEPQFEVLVSDTDADLPIDCMASITEFPVQRLDVVVLEKAEAKGIVNLVEGAYHAETESVTRGLFCHS